jgi:hypothetical protein
LSGDGSGVAAAKQTMAKIIEYAAVLQSLTALGFQSLYYNSGAFGFSPGAETISRGWIGPMDSSIRESARAFVRQVPVPQEPQLARLLVTAWQRFLPGPVWLMPKSHWFYELEFGSREWLPEVLKQVGIDPVVLQPLNSGAAIEFETSEISGVEFFVRELLTRLIQSDFQMVFTGGSTICTIHQKGQLWWTSSSAEVVEKLDLLIANEVTG